MRGDINLVNQLAGAMLDAVSKLEAAKNANKIEDFNKIKAFILDIQARISNEAEKGFC
jgi:hypothetical protein